MSLFVCVCVCVCVCVFARSQFHTELSTVSVSAGISVCHCVDLTCKWASHFITLGWRDKHLEDQEVEIGPWNEARILGGWHSYLLPSLIIPPHLLSLSLFVLLYQTAQSHLLHSALERFFLQVALRSSCHLLHANVSAPGDKNRTPGLKSLRVIWRLHTWPNATMKCPV